jgi:membrane-associated phospholipid phosphatase
MLRKVVAFDHALSGRLVAPPIDDPGRPRHWLTALYWFSQAGAYGIGWVVLFAIVITLHDNWKVAAVAAGCVLGTLVLNTGIKEVVRRPRPWYNPVGERPGTFSMPSAHTSMAMVGAAEMTVLIPELTVLWWVIAFGLAVSRIVLGMHYVLDVVAGVAFGTVLAVLAALPLIDWIR